MPTVSFIIGAAALAASIAQVSLHLDDDLQRCVAAAAENFDLSGEILISQHGKTLATVYRGHLSEPESPAIAPNDRFNIGSASKLFTAVAIGQMIDRGKLRLDEMIGDVVDGLTPEASRVTVAQLLNHTSGLGDFFKPENLDAMLRARSASDLLPLVSRDRPTFPPGTKFAYSNTGFVLLGVAVERLSGLSYGEYLRRNVFGPAGMTDTGLQPEPLATLAVGMTYVEQPSKSSPTGLVLARPASASAPPDTAQSLGRSGVHAKQERPKTAPGALAGYGSPAGGLFSTVVDLDRFANALQAGKLLSADTFKRFSSPQIQAQAASPMGPARYYGYGFAIAEEAGRRWVGHNGGTLGANAEFWFDPDSQWVIAVLANRDPPVATGVLSKLRPAVGGGAKGLHTYCEAPLGPTERRKRNGG